LKANISGVKTKQGQGGDDLPAGSGIGLGGADDISRSPVTTRAVSSRVMLGNHGGSIDTGVFGNEGMEGKKEVGKGRDKNGQEGLKLNRDHF